MPSIQDVTIIIPVYAQKPEHLDMLDRCLTSLAGQSGETIVWSDGSWDTLAEQFHLLQDRYRWAKFVFAGHNGKSVSRNSAAAMATREFLYPFDADDELMPGAVQTLIDEWGGTPLYSDLIKVHNGGTVQPYVLPSFTCEGIQEKCIASVNVLHMKEQWDTIGGWNKDINFLEDWDYNFRLFWEFGAQKVPKPLVRYHIHPDQHTMRASARQKQEAMRWVKRQISEYVRRNAMAGCCGKRRTTNPGGKTMATTDTASRRPLTSTMATRPVPLSVEENLATLGDPGPGKVWAKYFGGRGMGPHDRRGSATRAKYQRVQYGGVYAIKSQDAVMQHDFETGRTGCEFVIIGEPVVQSAPPTPAPVSASAPVAQVEERPQIQRTPVKVDRTPLTSDMMETYIQSMESMTVKELKNLLDSVGFGPDEMQALLVAEKAGKARLGAVKLLEKYLTKV